MVRIPKEKVKPKIIKEAKQITEKHNISLNFHMPYFLEISSYIPGISEVVVKFAKKELSLAKKLGTNIITIHSGYKEAYPAENFRTAVRNLKEIINIGKRYGMEIGIEHSPKGGGALCIAEEELLKVVNSVKDLKIVFDVGHANTIGTDPITYFKKIRDRIINIHLHDNDGKQDQHQQIGKGNINFKKFLKECKKSNYYGPFILEVFSHKNTLSYEDVLIGRKKILNIWNRI